MIERDLVIESTLRAGETYVFILRGVVEEASYYMPKYVENAALGTAIFFRFDRKDLSPRCRS